MSGLFLHIERLLVGYIRHEDGRIQTVTKVHRALRPTASAKEGVMVLPVSDPSHYKEGYTKELSDPIESVFSITKKTLVKAKRAGVVPQGFCPTVFPSENVLCFSFHHHRW